MYLNNIFLRFRENFFEGHTRYIRATERICILLIELKNIHLLSISLLRHPRPNLPRSRRRQDVRHQPGDRPRTRRHGPDRGRCSQRRHSPPLALHHSDPGVPALRAIAVAHPREGRQRGRLRLRHGVGRRPPRVGGRPIAADSEEPDYWLARMEGLLPPSAAAGGHAADRVARDICRLGPAFRPALRRREGPPREAALWREPVPPESPCPHHDLVQGHRCLGKGRCSMGMEDSNWL